MTEQGAMGAKMKDEPEYKVVGTSKRVDGYLVWEVQTKDGHLMAACYGGASAKAAATFCRELLAGSEADVRDALDYANAS